MMVRSYCFCVRRRSSAKVEIFVFVFRSCGVRICVFIEQTFDRLCFVYVYVWALGEMERAR